MMERATEQFAFVDYRKRAGRCSRNNRDFAEFQTVGIEGVEDGLVFEFRPGSSSQDRFAARIPRSISYKDQSALGIPTGSCNLVTSVNGSCENLRALVATTTETDRGIAQ